RGGAGTGASESTRRGPASHDPEVNMIPLALWLTAATETAGGDPLAFVGARVFDGSGRPPVEDAALVVRDGRIRAVGPRREVAIPAGAQRIDLAGKTILPGLVNTHGHVGETIGLRAGPELYSAENVVRQLGLYARYGVTTVFSLGGDQEAGFRLRERSGAPAPNRARLHVCGPVLTASTAEEAQRKVRELADLGPDLVKIRVDDNLGTVQKMAAPVYRAVIDEAHTRHLRVAAHVYY